MKQIAILGPTASGKSALAIEIAKKFNANILSLDSLSVYKEVDIVSAKPTQKEREGIRHFGIDILKIDEYFSASTFSKLYLQAKTQSEKDRKNLVITGGTGFYLKALTDGLSEKITPSFSTEEKIRKTLHDLYRAYGFIKDTDPLYAAKISQNDHYRIRKWYEIYYETGSDATSFFARNRPKAVIGELTVLEIDIDRATLRENIKKRTHEMIRNGLIDEVFYLESRYTRIPNPMKAIGIKETLSYLDGKIDLDTLKDLISTHTAQLAKRQITFNSSQFPRKIKLLKDDLIKYIDKYFN